MQFFLKQQKKIFFCAFVLASWHGRRAISWRSESHIPVAGQASNLVQSTWPARFATAPQKGQRLARLSWLSGASIFFCCLLRMTPSEKFAKKSSTTTPRHGDSQKIRGMEDEWVFFSSIVSALFPSVKAGGGLTKHFPFSLHNRDGLDGGGAVLDWERNYGRTWACVFNTLFALLGQTERIIPGQLLCSS